MRVALVSDWFLPRAGGIELHLRDLALALGRSGVDARIVTTTPGPREIDGVRVHRIGTPLLPIAGVAYTPHVMSQVRAVLRDEQFAVVHAHPSVISPLAYAGAIAGAELAIPTVLTFHSMLHRAALVLGASESLLRWTRGRVALTAVSSVVAAQAAAWLPEANVGVLPNGVDAGFWASSGEPGPARNDVVFVSAMRLTRKKRPERLLRSFAETVRITAGSPTVRLVIAGDGPDRAALARLALELGIGAQVTFAGHCSRDALRLLYASADVFVLPSERESFGLAALEARAAGLPVVAMLASGVRDFIVPGRNGLLAADAAELTRFMVRFALDAPFRAFVARANALAPTAHDWTAVAALHLQFYRAAAALRVAPVTISAG